MSRFYGTMRGSRGEASRLGGTMSGITAHVRGWDVGIRAACFAGEADSGDVCGVWITSGSNGSRAEWLLATVDQNGCVTLYEKPATIKAQAS